MPGSIVKIPFDVERWTFGRLLHVPFIRVFDLDSVSSPSISDIIASPTLFVVAVTKRALQRTRWPIVANTQYDEASETPLIPPNFAQDIADPERCEIVDALGQSIPATREQCKGLECLMVWDPEHVEQRLRDHYAGTPNVHVEYNRLK